MWKNWGPARPTGPDLLGHCGIPPGERHQKHNRGMRPLGTRDFKAPSVGAGVALLTVSSTIPLVLRVHR